MPRKSIVIAWIAVSALFAAVLAIAFLRWELANQAQRLQQVLAENRRLQERLRDASITARQGGDSPTPSNLDCPIERVQCPEPVEVVVTPGGRRLTSSREREEFVRAHLAERLDKAFFDGQLEEDQRHAALDLLMTIRALRISGQSPEELRLAQQELIDLTGMGVGELLETIEVSASSSKRPEQAVPIEEGELRKRFPDETSRRLGIAEPGVVERNRDGAWEVDD